MKKLFVLLILSLNALVQNLVSNGSFEILSNCPDNSNELNYAIGYTSPTNGSPDLFHICSTVDIMSVPENVLGLQSAKEGYGYGGIYPYLNQLELSVNFREYIQTNLSSTLENCSLYKLIFYVSLADSMRYAINSFGAHFSETAIFRNDALCFDQFIPQVQNPTNRMLDDKINWMKIEGSFMANGNEQYVTFGNFKLDNQIDTFSTTSNTWLSYMGSYYYIDDISLVKLSDSNLPAFAGSDTSILSGENVFIGQEIYNLNCTWSILETSEIIAANKSGITVSPTETTTYVVEQNLCGNITFDTVVVNVGYVGINESSPLDPSKGGRVKISPNPNNGSFELLNLASEVLPFSIRNTLGQVIYQDVLLTESKKVNLSLAKGVYFLTSNTSGFSEKIVVK